MRLSIIVLAALMTGPYLHAQPPTPKADVIPPPLKTPGEGFLGIAFMPDELGGVVVTLVQGGSAAKAGGVLEGDLILKLGDLDAVTPEVMQAYVRNLQPGTDLRLDVLRDGRRATLRIRLTERPEYLDRE